MGKPLFRTERLASLLMNVLRVNTLSGKFIVRDFVVMPNHIHVLLTLPGEITVEKAMQLIKGRFSFRARKELGFAGEVWQRGFSEVAIRDAESFKIHKSYIEQNPVKAGLVASPEEYLHGSSHLKYLKRMKA